MCHWDGLRRGGCLLWWTLAVGGCCSYYLLFDFSESTRRARAESQSGHGYHRAGRSSYVPWIRWVMSPSSRYPPHLHVGVSAAIFLVIFILNSKFRVKKSVTVSVHEFRGAVSVPVPLGVVFASKARCFGNHVQSLLVSAKRASERIRAFTIYHGHVVARFVRPVSA